MGWTGWLVLAVSLGGLYGLGLVLYRLFLSAKSLLRAITHSRALVAEAMAYEPMDSSLQNRPPRKTSKRCWLQEEVLRGFKKRKPRPDSVDF